MTGRGTLITRLGLGCLLGLAGPFVGMFLDPQALNSLHISRVRQALSLAATLSAPLPAQKLTEVNCLRPTSHTRSSTGGFDVRKTLQDRTHYFARPAA